MILSILKSAHLRNAGSAELQSICFSRLPVRLQPHRLPFPGLLRSVQPALDLDGLCDLLGSEWIVWQRVTGGAVDCSSHGLARPNSMPLQNADAS